MIGLTWFHDYEKLLVTTYLKPRGRKQPELSSASLRFFFFFSPLRDLRSRRDATKVREDLPVLVRSRKSLTVCPEVYLSEILGAAKSAI